MKQDSHGIPLNRRQFLGGIAATAVGLTSGRGAELSADAVAEVFLVPNFHPASCGWLANFYTERLYCSNSYLDHLDRVRDDPSYKFVLSEVNNMIAIMNFHPERVEEIKQRAKEGRVELVNANFLEMTVNLAGGEALIKQGVEGSRWQEQVMGVHPRFMWIIDTCGFHDQMGQITAGLGLDAMVYERKNKTQDKMHWVESPDGSRILALAPDGYAAFGEFFKTRDPMTVEELKKLGEEADRWAKKPPSGAPGLILGGDGDYSLAPLRKEYPKEFYGPWNAANPGIKIRIATLSEYVDAVMPGIKSGKIELQTTKGGTGYTFDSFWIECPKIKTWFRKNEHALQAAETLSTIASLQNGFAYPAQDLYESWILMLLSMDRNTLWGSAGGMVFEDEISWDVRDRLQYVEEKNQRVLAAALNAISPAGHETVLFNPLNWERHDPVFLELPTAATPRGGLCQTTPDGRTVYSVSLPSVGIEGLTPQSKAPARSRKIAAPQTIESRHYSARVDWKTGALVSLKLKPSGREVLGGPANVIVAEKPKPQKGEYGDFMSWRPDRTRLASSSDFPPTIAVYEGPLATIVEVTANFYGGALSRRVMRFYENYPRIDFETEVQDIPDITVVVAEFPLGEEITEVRRGIPGGFSHGAWSKPNLDLVGWAKGIVPTIRWIDYSLAGGGGVAIFDRGLTGRELNEKTPIIYLLNAVDKYYGYPNAWLSGKGKHLSGYALYAHEAEWAESRIPQMAWEYNCPPLLAVGRKAAAVQSFVQTSDNVIIEVIRREGNEIEMRLVECRGVAGMAEVILNLPHQGAALTNLRGKYPQALEGSGPRYRFPVRPQQIATIRFGAASSVGEINPVTSWDKFVPEPKRAALHVYRPFKGHPPRGDEPQT
ncbi:MAG: glycoside hydrolase family 38 C-terminal domain-containing protein [Terriglobia bacterium]|jgi:alpha-mannosidase